MFIKNDIINTPITKPTPAGIKTDKLKFAIDSTYSSYNPKEDNITALSTPGIIEEPATAIPNNIDWNIFGFVISGNNPLLKKNKLNPIHADINITK